MEEIKRLVKILNIELAIVIIFVALTGSGIFFIFYQHTNQSEMIMDQTKNKEVIMQLEAMDRFVNRALIELFLFFLFLSTIFIIISRRFTASFIKKIVLDLANKTKELENVKKSLEEAKAVLEIKVSARTKELKELVDNLELEVQRRTKEVYKRMQVLEKFQRLAVGRELKMIELKKKIKELEKTEKPK